MHDNKCTLAVIGDPIEHSLSPVMHNAMLKHLGVELGYTKICVPKDDLQTWMQSEQAQSLQGFNITMPHKNKIMPFMTSLSKQAQKIASVNTAVRKDGQLHGHTTDGIGFIRALQSDDIDIKGNVAILGSGGACDAVSCALLEHLGEDGQVTIFCRKPDTVHTDKVCVKAWSNLQEQALENTDILINATPLGMHTKGQFENFDFLRALPKHALVCDLIYIPEETQLLKQAQKLKLQSKNGLGMLIHQGIVALELFLDTKLDIKEMENIVKNTINARKF